MTNIRADMAASCAPIPEKDPTKMDLVEDWMGKVRLTEQHLAEAIGKNESEKRADILAEARIGFSQKSGFMSANAKFVKEIVDGKEVEYIVARNYPDPSTSALGKRIKRL